MRKLVIFIGLMAGWFSLTQSSPLAKSNLLNVKLNGSAQGTTYHISYFAKDSVVSVRDVDLVLAGIDSSLSLYKTYSTISKFNNSASGYEIDDHFRKVFMKSVEVAEHTGGLFDITVQPLVQLWGFGPVQTQTSPDSALIQSTLQCVGAEKVKLHNQRLIKTLPCVKVDMNGIAQGYSVDVLAEFLKSRNINNFMVELGGEIRIEGQKPDGGFFKVGIEVPENKDSPVERFQQTLQVKSGAITTSGNYRNFRTSGTKRLSHIINPKTGFPEESELISVTVYAKDAMTADAYDNALMLMGVKKALAFVGKSDDLAAYFIYRQQDGSVADTACNQFKALLNQN